MESEPLWVSPDDVLRHNQLTVAETGEPFLLRDYGLLESAVARARNLWGYEEERDVLRLGLALMFGIARNHPFEQGNKRTGFHAFRQFLNMNGYELDLPDVEAVADAIIAVIEHGMQEEDFELSIADHVVPLG